MNRILSFITKQVVLICALSVSLFTHSQTAYGLRVGADLHRLARTTLSDNYSGFELSGDLRLKKKLMLSAELGNENFLDQETLGDYLLYETQYTSEIRRRLDGLRSKN